MRRKGRRSFRSRCNLGVFSLVAQVVRYAADIGVLIAASDGANIGPPVRYQSQKAQALPGKKLHSNTPPPTSGTGKERRLKGQQRGCMSTVLLVKTSIEEK